MTYRNYKEVGTVHHMIKPGPAVESTQFLRNFMVRSLSMTNDLRKITFCLLC